MAAAWKSFFKGKRVTQLGLGLLGRGVRDAAFLAKHGARVLVTDKKTAAELAPSVRRLARYADAITFRLGEHRLGDFTAADFVLKAAGVPLASPEIAAARAAGIPIEMDASLFAKLAPPGVILVGVTGTRGKSTTSHLIFHILQRARRRVFLAGNVRDTATLPLLEKVRAGDIVVLELDSWQLQGFGDARLSPHVAVFTTFMDDHLNYYGGDRDAYFADKANIFRFQKAGAALIVGEQSSERVLRAAPPVEPVIARAIDVRPWKTQLLGEHNAANVACAVAAVRSLGVPETAIKRAVASFPGVPGRLECIRSVRGVSYYNDTTATTPEAAAAGLAALAASRPRGRIILIAGGADKQLNLSALLLAVKRQVSELVLLPGTGTDRLVGSSELKTAGGVHDVSSMAAAVKKAQRLAKRGDVVVLSPGFASFGLFKNEYDRGDQFVRAVRRLR